MNSFEINTSPEGRYYIKMTHTKTTKKSQGDESTNSKNFHKDNNNLIVEQPGKPRCPVASFEKYLARLDHSLDLLFQQPKKKKKPYIASIPKYGTTKESLGKK